MPRKKMVDPAALSVSELRHLLVTKEKMEKLEERRSALAKELAAVESEMKKISAAPAGKSLRKKSTAKKKKVGRPAKKASAKKKVGRPAKKAAAKKKVGRPAKKVAAKKKVGRPAGKVGRPAKKVAAKAPRVTVESVVADLIRGNGSPMSFQEIFAEITKQKLIKTKSKNFANVLRRTLSTSKALKRVSRGVYNVK